MNMAISKPCSRAPTKSSSRSAARPDRSGKRRADPRSKQLVSLVCDVPLEVPLDDLALQQPEGKTLVAFFKAMEFSTITKRAAEAYGIEAAMIEPDPAFAGSRLARPQRRRPARDRREREENGAAEASTQPEAPARNARYGEQTQKGVIATGPGELAAARAAEARAQKFDVKSYETILEPRRLDAYIAAAFEAGAIAVDTETASLRSDAGRSRRRLALRRAGTRLLHTSCGIRAKAPAIFSAATKSARPIAGRECSRG